MPARRLVRLVDRITLAGHPATEALVERAARAGARGLGRLAGAAARVGAPRVPLQRLGEAFDEGLEASKRHAPPEGRVLSFPHRG
jgi:hypothetical protein